MSRPPSENSEKPLAVSMYVDVAEIVRLVVTANALRMSASDYLRSLFLADAENAR